MDPLEYYPSVLFDRKNTFEVIKFVGVLNIETGEQESQDLEFLPVTWSDYERIYPYTSAYGEGSCQHSPVSMASLAEKYDTYVITDEVYEHIVFDPYQHVYAGALPEIRDRVICCSSLSKTYSITGWRLGYLIGPEDVIEGAKKVHDFLTVGAAAPLQEAAVVGLEMPESYYRDLKEMYTRKRNTFLAGLDRIGLQHTIPQGSYFVMVDISEFQKPGMRFHGESDMTFCEWMIRNVGVAAVPGSSFFREPVNHLIRLHFARSEETLLESIERLSQLPRLV